MDFEDAPKSPTLEAIRLPNISTLPKDIGMGESIKQSQPTDGWASPSNLLSGGVPDIREDFRSTVEGSDFVSFEGEIFRKAPEGKIKPYWFSLLGKELYCYRKKEDKKHKGMHSMAGIYLKVDKEEVIDGKYKLYPFRLIFPPNRGRSYYLRTEAERDMWAAAIKKAIGYSNVEDFYEIQHDLGKGKFGVVKLGIHKKTGAKVAIKCIKKKAMKLKELELQKREIEVLKLCQHPNIIRLLDVFENPEVIYIVLEYLEGGDLFVYLDKRDFKITEDQARSIAHQIALALQYLHSYGIAHRDIKLENIMMVDNSEVPQVKLADFGLSKMIGPNETTNDPFGTLSYVAPEVLLQKQYGKNVDIWSLGVIVYVLLSGMLPFDSNDQRETARQTIYDPVPFDHIIWNYVSTEAKDLIAKLLIKDRFKRIQLDAVLAHPWITKKKLATE